MASASSLTALKSLSSAFEASNWLTPLTVPALSTTISGSTSTKSGANKAANASQFFALNKSQTIFSLAMGSGPVAVVTGGPAGDAAAAAGVLVEVGRGGIGGFSGHS